jgi:hypothetical protein
MSVVDVDAVIKELKADRYISFNVLMGAMSQLKKSVSQLEDRIQREGDSINFSANSDLLENAMHLWKASHRIYQIDSTIAQLTHHTQKIVEAASVAAGDNKEDAQGGNTAFDLNATETKP